MSNFEVLSDRDHIRKRAGMYIGSCTSEPYSAIIDFKYQTKNIVPGLLKIINEVLDNCVDEYIRTKGSYANKIELTIDTLTNQIIIKDNGRGIPVEKHGDEYRPVLAWTRARAGSNFGDERTTLGANGVGSFATNCFSTQFTGTTCDGKSKIVVECTDHCGVVTHKVSTPANPVRGTEVAFTPDLKEFGLESFTQDHIDLLRDRIQNLSICYPDIAFKFNGEKIHFNSVKQIAKNFSENAVTYETENTSLVFAPADGDEEFRFLSYVNGLHIKNGGTHIEYLLNSIIDNLRPAIKKKWKIEVLPNQIRQHLLFASWIRSFPNLKFDSQTKERITNTNGEVSAFFGDFTEAAQSIAKKIISTESIINPMIEAILHKKELMERREAAKVLKNNKKKKIVNHLTASSNNWEEKQIFLAEGQSAIGSLIKVRDARIHGGYALRGKVMNTNGMKTTEIVKNKELSELMSIIGLDFDELDYNELSYGNIVVMTDQDPDGSSIFCTLLQFFSHWPKLFDEGRIYRIISPLYIARKKNDTKWFYTQEEYNEAKDELKGYEVSYNKGLGSLDVDDYKTMIRNQKLIKVTAKDAEDYMKLEMAFGNDSNVRKEWMTGETYL